MLAGTPQQKKLGDDDGCFESALASVRKWGGVIEHPEGSHAWRSFGLNLPPRSGGWVNADFIGGFTCCVEQGAYGHRARKATWLYAFGCELPTLKWGSADGKFGRLDDGYHSKEERAFHIKKGVLQRLSKKQRLATPIEFRDLLISIAATAKTTAEQCRAFASCKRASTRTLRKGEYGYHGIDIPVCKECWQWGSDHYLKAVSSTTNLPGEPDETP